MSTGARRQGSSGRVVVVGAGLAGLACALRLHAAGLDVLVREAGPRVGGRVATDVVDGFSCDVGFQLVNPAYPALVRVLDEIGAGLPALDLRSFGAGVVVAARRRRWVLGDPRRLPSAAASSLLAPVGSLREKAAFAAWALRAGYGDAHRLRDHPRGDTTLAAALGAIGVSGRLRSAVVTPFLSGVLGEDAGSTSAAFAALVVRSFVRGTPGVPAGGVGVLPRVMAAALPEGSVALGSPVRALDEPALRGAAAVVLATDAAAAKALVPTLAVPRSNALTTLWFAADDAPTASRLLHVDAEARGPLVNTAVVTNVAPAYAPAGRHLVAATVLGDARRERGGLGGTERAVRAQAALVYGTSTRGWELVRVHALPGALPALPPPLDARRPPALGDGLFVAGDHRGTASQQGAIASGRRAADAVLSHLRGP